LSHLAKLSITAAGGLSFAPPIIVVALDVLFNIKSTKMIECQGHLNLIVEGAPEARIGTTSRPTFRLPEN
jgi:hypothetical protein